MNSKRVARGHDRRFERYSGRETLGCDIRHASVPDRAKRQRTRDMLRPDGFDRETERIVGIVKRSFPQNPSVDNPCTDVRGCHCVIDFNNLTDV